MRISLICGSGKLPVEIARKIKEKNHELIVISFENSNPALKKISDEFVTINSFKEILNYLVSKKIKKTMLAGYINPKILLTDKTPNLDDKRPTSVFKYISQLLKKNGIEVISLYSFIKHLLVRKGLLTNSNLNEQQKKDIKLGYKIAKKISQLDIGSTVVTKKGCVITVESFDGTDNTIQRAGEIAGDDTVIVKVARKNPWKFDPPVVGLKTLRVMKKAKSKVLAIESKKVIFLDLKKSIEYARNNGISIISI